MARYMRIEAGVVTNAEEWPTQPVVQGVTYVQSDTAKLYDLYANGVFTTPAPVVVVPASISKLQAQLQLQASGLLTAVNAAVAAADPVTQIYYNSPEDLHRNHPVVATLGAALGLNSAQIDALFIAASKLS